MAMDYVRIQRNIHTGATPGTKYLARIYRKGNISMDSLCTEISEATTMSYPDVLGVLKALEIIISRHVLNGEGVRLDLLGSFVPSIHATAKTALADVTPETIRKAACRFFPSVKFKTQLTKTGFNLVDLTVHGYQPNA